MRPRSLALTAARAEASPEAINWDRLWVEFCLEYDVNHDGISALKRAFKAARYAPGVVSSPAAEAVIGEVARLHGLAIDEVMFGGQAPEYVAARDEAFARLNDDGRGMSLNSIGRLFRKHHTSIMAGVARHRARVAPARSGLVAVKAAA